MDVLEKASDRKFQLAARFVDSLPRINRKSVFEPQWPDGRKPPDTETIAGLHAIEHIAEPVIGVADIEENHSLELGFLKQRESALGVEKCFAIATGIHPVDGKGPSPLLLRVGTYW